ncbi:O-antigen ligase domain-containing protein [Jiella endophytica]|uniref:O-antigen ligase domain-containing protein n=1 Tax=Jiella endophytica TaxID=2558362 RepID=A0A4Y8RPX2_9HYPH|nr:O-antigen ligase domain-containing protein [Jiella endophytica]
MIPGVVRFVFIIAAAISIIPLGSTRPEFLYFSCILQGIVFCSAVAAAGDARQSRPILLALLGIIASAALYLIFQSLFLPASPFANPAWAIVAVAQSGSGGAISVAPDVTMRSLPALIAPFFAFGSAALLSRDDEKALRIWRGLALLGAAVALFGLVRHAAFPDLRLFGQVYLDRADVTSVFVNRNNAATFFGLASLAGLGWLAWHRTRGDRRRAGRPGATGLIRLAPHSGTIAICLGFLSTILALLLTRSRAGVLLSALALLLPIAFFLAANIRRLADRRTQWLAVGGTVAAAIVAVAVLGQRTILRAELIGTNDERFCLYRETLAAIRDHPLFGTGFGTFDDVFPAYRLAQCGIYGLPERAHNSYLEAYLGLGLPFLLLLAVCLAALLGIYWNGLTQRRRLRPIPIVCLSALGLMLAHSAVDFPIQIHGIAIYFAALLGCGAGVSLARSQAPSPRS